MMQVILLRINYFCKYFVMDVGNSAPRGMVVTPHHLATQSAVKILRDGGTAMEAVVAAAATLAVVYPHMNSIGGDSFWLIVPPHGEPFVIEACGEAGSLANMEFFDGYDEIPKTGPKSAITVAGTVGGWEEALKYVSECGYQRMSLTKLLDDAIHYAEHGFPVSNSHVMALKDYNVDKSTPKSFINTFMPNGKIPKIGDKFCQLMLATTLKELTKHGLNSFYKSELAQLIAEDMTDIGMPITESDLSNYKPVRRSPLKLLHEHGELFNVPPPTQGLVSLSILGILDRLRVDGRIEEQFIHSVVEATKQAFVLRDRYITDPRCMKVDPQLLLAGHAISEMANKIKPDRASTAAKGKGPGDTIWLGVMDNKGFSVSFIQSIYCEFGSGVVLPKTGILWHNRGIAFKLEKDHILSLEPGKKPFHTLNPAAARLSDGRVMVYGTRGGDGQSQIQAAIFHRYVVQGHGLQKSISLPRWVYGATTGDRNDVLYLEDRFSEEVINYLRDRGHEVSLLPSYSEEVGQAGALVRHPNGMMEGASDPRSDGNAAGF